MGVVETKIKQSNKIELITAQGKFEFSPDTFLLVRINGKLCFASAKTVFELLKRDIKIELVFRKRLKREIKYSDIVFELLKINKGFKKDLEKLFRIDEKNRKITPKLSIFLLKNKSKIDAKGLGMFAGVEDSTVKSWFNGKVILPRNRGKFLKYLRKTFGKDHEFTKWFSDVAFPRRACAYDRIVAFFRFIGICLSEKKHITFKNDIKYSDLNEDQEEDENEKKHADIITLYTHIIPESWERSLKNLLNEETDIYVEVRNTKKENSETIYIDKRSIGIIKPVTTNKDPKILKDIKSFINEFNIMTKGILEQHIKKFNAVKGFLIPPFFSLFLDYKPISDKKPLILIIEDDAVKEIFLEIIKSNENKSETLYEKIVEIINNKIKESSKIKENLDRVCDVCLSGIDNEYLRNKLRNKIIYPVIAVNEKQIFITLFFNAFLKILKEYGKHNKSDQQLVPHTYNMFTHRVINNIICKEDVVVINNNKSSDDDYNEFLERFKHIIIMRMRYFIDVTVDDTPIKIFNSHELYTFFKGNVNNQKKIIKKLNDLIEKDIENISKEIKNIVSNDSTLKNLITTYKKFIHLGDVFTLPFVFANIYNIARNTYIDTIKITSKHNQDNKIVDDLINTLKKNQKELENIKNSIRETLIIMLRNSYLKNFDDNTKTTIINDIVNIFNSICNLFDNITSN